jgi:hypothetical protein
MLYHRNSAVVLWLIVKGLVKGWLIRDGWRATLSRVEAGGDVGRPLVKIYSRRQVRRIFRMFRHVRISVAQMSGLSALVCMRIQRGLKIRPFLERLDRPAGITDRILAPRFGFFLLIDAIK